MRVYIKWTDPTSPKIQSLGVGGNDNGLIRDRYRDGEFMEGGCKNFGAHNMPMLSPVMFYDPTLFTTPIVLGDTEMKGKWRVSMDKCMSYHVQCRIIGLISSTWVILGHRQPYGTKAHGSALFYLLPWCPARFSIPVRWEHLRGCTVCTRCFIVLNAMIYCPCFCSIPTCSNLLPTLYLTKFTQRCSSCRLTVSPWFLLDLGCVYNFNICAMIHHLVHCGFGLLRLW